MDKNKTNNLILAGAIISIIGSIISVFLIGYMLYINILFGWLFSIFGAIFKIFFNFIGLGLAISSVILSILCVVPKFKNNKKLVLTAGVFNVAFGFIIGGVLLIVGSNNISNSPVISSTNTTTQIISTEPMNKEIISPEIKDKNINITKSEQNLDSLKITKKQFKYKKLILAGLTLSLIGAVIGFSINAFYTFENLTELRRYIIPRRADPTDPIIYIHPGSLVNIASFSTFNSIGLFTLLIMSIIGLSTLKKNKDILLIFIAAIAIPLFNPIFINSFGGILILVGVIIKKITEQKEEIIQKTTK
ncbi:hypothetical protein [Mycoplasma mycoides]|uniref:hypothetical protein n=1 Tax=Mycoplasma mycoides TaxID=2102 RepID=UPI00223F8DC7|nr:hypothetical protein [Mycoplasma mycoides]QVJ95300.1 hypothetical protein I7631_03200 [Mycoplasma mycoides subsp. capri]